MSNKTSYKSYKEARERRQRYGPLIMGAVAIMLVAVGILLIFMWARGTSFSFGAEDTPTPTITATETPEPPAATPTATDIFTPTITLTPTETTVPTPAEPFSYLVQSGDSLISIADQFGVDFVAIMLLNDLTNESVLFAGDELIIPNPDMGLPTATPLPTGLARGAIIEYFVLPGDSLQLIAEEFLSTVDEIVEENELEDDSVIFPGQILRIPYQIITPAPSDTPALDASPTPTFTATPGG
jgi:LysM repeat protein